MFIGEMRVEVRQGGRMRERKKSREKGAALFLERERESEIGRHHSIADFGMVLFLSLIVGLIFHVLVVLLCM